MIAFPPTTDADVRADRIRNLLAEARGLAAEHVIEMESTLAKVGRLSTQVLEAGDIYPPGLREIARRLIEDAMWATQTLAAIRQRTLDHENSGSWRAEAIEELSASLVPAERLSFAPGADETAQISLPQVSADGPALDGEVDSEAPGSDQAAARPPTLRNGLRGKFRSQAAA